MRLQTFVSTSAVIGFVAASLGLLASWTQPVEATWVTTTHYHDPTYDGYRLDWCLTWARDCGEPAARVFCKWKGKGRLLSFAKTDYALSATKTIGGQEICRTGINHSHCDGFRVIQCNNT